MHIWVQDTEVMGRRGKESGAMFLMHFSQAVTQFTSMAWGEV